MARRGAEIVLPVAAESWPSGPASAETHERLCRLVLDEVERGGFDAILLDLHGAMVAEGVEDAEGDLLRRLREIDPTTPVAVTLDMHANLYDDIVRHATVISGFHTYPHVDIHAAGLRAANVIVRTLKGEIKPVMRWGNKPMLPHVMRQGTHAEPNKSLQERCIALEAQGVLAASVFVGFPHADIREAGLSAVVCTDGKAEQAEQLRDELLERAWNARADWVFHPEPLEAAITRAKAVTQGPVVLLDHYDNTGSGGTMDTTAVLAEMLRQGLDNAVFYAICDPQAAREAAAAGVGSQIRIKLGGKVAMPAIRQASEPLEISGRVKLVFDGVYLNRGPMYRGVRNDTGLTVVIDTGSVEIVVVSRHQEPFDVNCLLSAGIDPLQSATWPSRAGSTGARASRHGHRHHRMHRRRRDHLGLRPTGIQTRAAPHLPAGSTVSRYFVDNIAGAPAPAFILKSSVTARALAGQAASVYSPRVLAPS